jgi:phosphomannomutase
MKSVVLFDMDGTITPARQSIEDNMVDTLIELLKVSEVGIVTGSGFEYVMQQCGSFFNSEHDFSKLTILPCNGTQKYIHLGGEWVQHSTLNMREHLGEDFFRKLMFLLSERMYITHLTHATCKLPLTGHFISYRDSLVNWCPIGRSATNGDRERFIEIDKDRCLRETNMEVFHRTNLCEKVAFAMGGNTSIDIYPMGWDKTYALNHYENHDHWFVGDRCTAPTGNDKPLYDKIKETKPNQAFEVKTTSDTIKIIKDIINTLNTKE